MIARATAYARATADADATWRAGRTDLRTALAEAAMLDLDDYFLFTVGTATTMRGEGAEGALRFPIQARLAGRLFEPVHLDINLTPHDPRPVEELVLRNLFDFAGLPSVVVPAISPAQQLAEKLHAYTRDYGRHDNTRVKDLYDMLVIADHLPLPRLGELADACATTFALRDTPWPPTMLDPPPASWETPWSGFARIYRARFTSLSAAYDALVGFWQPSCTRTVPKPAHGTAALGLGRICRPSHRRSPATSTGWALPHR